MFLLSGAFFLVCALYTIIFNKNSSENTWIFSFALGIWLLICALLAAAACRHTAIWLKALYIGTSIVTTFIFVLGLIAICFISLDVHLLPNEHASEKSVLIVLGCTLNKDQPADVLVKRLDLAADFLEKNPELPCILSGGRVGKEEICEAEAMEKYLLSKGIAAERLNKETASQNTEQNIAYSFAMLPKQVNRVIILTSRFHLYRAQAYAKKAGSISIDGLGSKTGFPTVVHYLLREIAAVYKMWLHF